MMKPRGLATHVVAKFASVALAAAACAQGSIVSPVGAASVEGNTGLTQPFLNSAPTRYMQIHGDVAGAPRVITGIEFRVDTWSVPMNWTSTASIDVEVWMGEGVSQELPSYTFDDNYATPKQLVLPQTVVTWGPQGPSSPPGPTAFNGSMQLVFATPFLYSGNNPLIWEVVAHAQSVGSVFGGIDMATSPGTFYYAQTIGNGCYATGQSVWMTLDYFVEDVGGTLLMNPTIAHGPANSFAFLGVGFSDPNLSVPGLCTTVHTQCVFVQALGLTSSIGAIGWSQPTGVIVVPNVLAGVPIHTQAFVVDPGSSLALPITVSNGCFAFVPAPSAPAHRVTRLSGGSGDPGATMAYFVGGEVGQGLVTRFHHQ